MSLLTRFFGFFQTRQTRQSRPSPAESKQAVDKACACCVDLHTCLGSLDDTQWDELLCRCSDLGFGFVDIPTEVGCANSHTKYRYNGGACENLTIDSSSEPSIVPSFPASSWKSQFESVARQVLDSTELPHIQFRHGSDTLSSSHAQEPFSPPALTDNGIRDSQLQMDIVTDSALNCRDSSEVPDNQISHRPGDAAALSPTQGFQNNLIGFRRNSNLDGVDALSANSANYHSQIISPGTAEVNFVDPSEIATFHLSDSQCCSTDSSPVGVTGHDREVDQAMIDDDDAFPWSSTPASVNSERATSGTSCGIFVIRSFVTVDINLSALPRSASPRLKKKLAPSFPSLSNE